MDTAKCNKCEAVKPLSEFPKNKSRKNGHLECCKLCHSEANNTRHSKNKDRINAQRRDEYSRITDEERAKRNASKNAYRERRRREAIAGYGGVCNCCGESEYAFLAIDHVNNDGAEERRKKGRSTDWLVNKIIRENFPPQYQVLCHNCNIARHRWGACPHQAEHS